MAVTRHVPLPNEQASWLHDVIAKPKKVIPATNHDDVNKDKVADVEVIETTTILHTPAVLIWVGSPVYFYGHMPLCEARELYPEVLARHAIKNRLTDKQEWQWAKTYNRQIPNSAEK